MESPACWLILEIQSIKIPCLIDDEKKSLHTRSHSHHDDLATSTLLGTQELPFMDLTTVKAATDFGMARIFCEKQNAANTRRIVGT